MLYIYYYTYIYKGVSLSCFMKIGKLLTLDIEVVEYLKKQDNASSLVNRLILENMDSEDMAQMTMEQLQAEKDCNKAEREFKTKCKELRKNARK